MAALAAALLVYWLLHQRYYLSYVDDAWCVSQAHFFFDTGKTEDYLFRAPDAPDRVLVFFRTYLYVYGAVLNWLGWTKSNALILSSLFIWLSAAIWFFICRRLKFSATLQALIPVSMLLFPAYFSAAHLARYDALVFFLASLSFLCFLCRRYLLAGVFLVMGMECHPMGVAAAFYILSYVVSDRTAFFADRRKLLRTAALFSAGAALGLGYVWWLHPDLSFERVRITLAIDRSMNNFAFGFIGKYFTDSYWYRHDWELPLILGAVALFIKHRLWKRNAFPAIFLVAMIVCSFTVGRANANYMVFAFPAFSVLMFSTFEELQMLGKVVPAIGVVLAVIYGVHYGLRHDFDFNRITAETRASLVNPSLPVIGMPDNWFAVPEREFYPIYPSVSWIPRLGLKEFYLVRNDYISNESANYHALIATLHQTHDCVSIRHFKAFRDQDVEIFQCSGKVPDGNP
jgi:hypothetical protein